MIIMNNIGEALRETRTYYDLTQDDIAKIMNISKSSISHYEKNDWIIPIKNLALLADHLNISIDYILKLTKVKNYNNSRKGIDLNTMSNRICEICSDLNYNNVQFAKYLNTSESNIRNYKKGIYPILTAFAVQMALKNHYSIDWIIGKSDIKFINFK